MRTVDDQLARYAAYHRDARNRATHFVGVPLIVAAVTMLLSRPVLAVVGGIPLSAATIVVVAAAVFYLALDVALGEAMAVLLAAALVLGGWAAAQPTTTWLALGVGGFVVGWLFQLVGHVYEGRKPAFVDDVAGLLIGPLFVVAEAAFALGWRRALKGAIDARAGPTSPPARPG